MDWIELPGTVLRYELSGRGRPIVLVHEMGGTLNSWDAVAPRLAETHAVLRYDQRGAGLSEKASGRLDLDALADDLDGLADAVGLEGPILLVGAAVGAGIALRHAVRRPGKAAGLVGFSPVTACPSERREAVLAHADRIEGSGAGEGLRAMALTSIPNILPEILRTDEAAYRGARARWLANDPRSFAAIYRMFAGLDLAPDYPAVRTPCLLVGAEHDGLRPPAEVKALAAAIPGAAYRSLPTGHVAAVQTPGLVVETIRAFAAEIGH
jgi:3-oxoadipate enol-lactonase